MTSAADYSEFDTNRPIDIYGTKRTSSSPSPTVKTSTRTVVTPLWYWLLLVSSVVLSFIGMCCAGAAISYGSGTPSLPVDCAVCGIAIVLSILWIVYLLIKHHKHAARLTLALLLTVALTILILNGCALIYKTNSLLYTTVTVDIVYLVLVFAPCAYYLVVEAIL